MRIRVVVALVSWTTLAASGLVGQVPAASWQALPPLPVPVRSPAVATDGSRIFVVGGTSATSRSSELQILDLLQLSWTRGAPLPVSVDWASAVWAGGALHVVGGVTNTASATRHHFVYSPESDAWRTSVPLPYPLAGAAAASTGDRIYVFAGNAGQSPVYTAGTLVLELETGRWSRAQDVPTPRINWAGAVDGSDVHLTGGGLAGLTTSDEILVFNTDEDIWTHAGSMDVPREAAAVAASGGLICTAGGRLAASGNFNRPLASVFCYEALSGERVEVADLPAARQEAAGASTSRGIIVLGGADADARVAGDVWLLVVPALQ